MNKIKILSLSKSCNNLRPFFIMSVLIPINLQFQLFIITRDLNNRLPIQHFASIGVEALAGVLAIIVSVSFVLVQLSSQEYSKRVMEYYIRSLSFWILIIVFTITIVCNILMLNYQFEQPYLEALMLDLCIILPIICFLSLMPYFWVTMNILQPKNLINQLLKRVDLKYLKSIQDSWKNGFFPLVQDRDHALAVADIIKRSIESNDRSIITDGLSKMCECYKHLIININANNLYFFSNPLEAEYLFSWDEVSGIDSKRLLKFLRDDLSSEWVRDAKIEKFETRISIVDDGNWAKITLGDKKKKAVLTICDDRSYTLEVRKEHGDLKIYGKSLNKEVILKKLIKVFKTKGFPAPKILPPREEKEDKWVLKIGPEPGNEKIPRPQDKKIYIIKIADGTLNIYDNVVSAYFIKHFSDIARIAIINSDNDSITRILKIFEDMIETHNSKGITYDDPTYYVLAALYNIAHEAIKSELTAQTKIDIIEKFVEVVKNSKKPKSSKSKLNVLAIESIENSLTLATISLLGGLGVCRDKINLLEVGKRAAQKNQLHAANEAIEQLKNVKKIEGGTHIEDAIKIILAATKYNLKMQSEAIKLGVYIAKEHLSTISKGPTGINVLANSKYCVFTELTSHQIEIMLLMRNCCVKSILKSCESKKLRSCCKKTLSNLGQGREALPICMITFNYLTAGISEIMGKEFELKSVKWNEHLGFPELTFRPVE